MAAGRFDGFWELKLYAWDVAAGKLLVEEAGGTVTDFHENPLNIYGQEILASNGRIHEEMIRCYKKGIKTDALEASSLTTIEKLRDAACAATSL